MSKIIGIDLGTSDSCVAVLENGKPVVIAGAAGSETVPSAVSFAPGGERLSGRAAKRRAVTDADRTVLSVRRKLGTSEKVRIGGQDYPPERLCSVILRGLKETAENYLGEKVSEAVVTVPSCFSSVQRQAVIDAGRIAGLNVLRVIHETSAAAMAYCLGREESCKILVYSLGAGFCSVSVLESGDGVFEVLSTGGSSSLGCDDFDRQTAGYLAECFLRESGIDLRNDRTAMRRLTEAAEKARVELSAVSSAYIRVPYLASDAAGPKHLDMTLTREKFNALNAGLVRAAADPVQRALQDAGLLPSQIDRVLLIGGGSRIPAVRNAVLQIAGKEPSGGIDPKQCAAAGAAVQAGILSGEITGLLLLDTTPMSIGIETEGHVFTKMIDRNTTVPVIRSQVFSTASDNQSTVDIHVLQGEQPKADENISLGCFRLTGIAPAPRGVPRIEVSFTVDNSGILSVSARDQATGKQQEIAVTARAGLSESEIARLAAEEERLAEKDRAQRREREILERADSIIAETEKTLQQHGSRLSAADRNAVRAEIAAFREVRKTGDTVRIQSAESAFADRVYPLLASLYDKQSAPKFRPYSGDQPYLFASYSHRDAEKVVPILRQMNADGFRVWYDVGIDPGTEWDVNISDHIEKCGFFIAFLSKNFLQSSNCLDELNYARDLEKARLLVYLEDLVLPGNLKMRHGRIQAVFHSRYSASDQDEFYSRLYAAEGISGCRNP